MSKEAMKLALYALEVEDMACRYEKDPTPEHIAKAITALREALAEQPAQQKPVAALYDDGTWIAKKTEAGRALNNRLLFAGSPAIDVYTTQPPQRTWVGLTDEEVMVAAYQAGFDIHEDYENEDDPEAMHWWTPDGEACDDSLLKLRDLIEAKLREKNT